jgi:hypothetical protein
MCGSELWLLKTLSDPQRSAHMFPVAAAFPTCNERLGQVRP